MKSKGNAINAVGICVLIFLLFSGCSDTAGQIEAMDRSIQNREVAAAAALADRLIASPDLMHTGDLQVYLSSSLAERSLKLFDGLEYELPNSGGIKLTLGSIRATFTTGVAGLRVDMRARKGKLSIKVVAAAVLLPEKAPIRRLTDAEVLAIAPKDPNVPIAATSFYRTSPLRFRVQIVEFAPDVRWGPFSSDMKGFVTEFSRLKVNEILNERLPALELPFDKVLTLDLKQRTQDVTIEDKVMVRISTPAIKWGTTFSISDVIVLERGIHIAGTLRRLDSIDVGFGAAL